MLVIGILIFSLLAQSAGIKPSQLHGSSPYCQSQQKHPETETCDLQNSSKDSLLEISQNLTRQEGNRFASTLKSHYFSEIERTIASQYAAATWFGKVSPLDRKNNHSLRKSFEAAKSKCTGRSNQQFQSIAERLKPESVKSELRGVLSGHDGGEEDRYLTMKRLLIANIEVNRIERFLHDRPLSPKQKQELQARLLKIRQTYPLVSTGEGFLLRQVAKAQYQVTSPDSTVSHPEIDQILFPKPKERFKPLKAGTQLRSGNEGLVNKILKEPLSEQIEADINDLIGRSLSKSFESIGEFCDLNACQMFQLDLETTAQKLTERPGADIASRAVCSCNLKNPTEYVGGGTQLVMAGAVIGGIVLCPFTLGVGCYGAAVATAGLTASAAANTYGAIRDVNQSSPVAKTASSLPGLSQEARDSAKSENVDNTGRIIGGVAETGLSGGLGVGLAKQGRKLISNPQAYKPHTNSATHSDDVAQFAEDQKEYLQATGVKFEVDPYQETFLKKRVLEKSDRVQYENPESGFPHYGEILKIKELPRPVAKGTVKTRAFDHPEMAEYLKKMKDLNVELVVDTSMANIDVGAYYSPTEKLIALRPDSKWQDFIHEFQHAQFDKFIKPKLKDLSMANITLGKSARDVLPPAAVKNYSEKELKNLDKLIKQGHTTRGINETLSVNRELEAMGWSRYSPAGSETRAYGAKHRVDSLLELKEQFGLSESQLKAISQGKREIIFANVHSGVARGGKYAYDTAKEAAKYVPAAIIVYKGGKNGYEIYENPPVYYNQKTGDMIFKSPDGNLMRTNAD